MKTLPYLKQLTYAGIVLAFPFIFSASRDTSIPEPVQAPVKKVFVAQEPVATETIKTIKLTVDSLKMSSRSLLHSAEQH